MLDRIKNMIWVIGIICFIFGLGLGRIARKHRAKYSYRKICKINWCVDRGWRPNWIIATKKEAREIAGSGRIYPCQRCTIIKKKKELK